MPITHDVLHRFWLAYKEAININNTTLADYYLQALSLAHAIAGGRS